MNKKVPITILSCFLIFFVLQGMLKISGVFIFEKALCWEIFEVIDNSIILQVIYYTLLNSITTYCLSFALTTRPYSNKWYHYVIIILNSALVINCRMFIQTPFFMEFVYDIFLFVFTPTIIYLTTSTQYKSINNPIVILSMNILLYFTHLGLCYWSNLLSSLLPITQVALNASSHFLIRFESYIGLILLMITMNLYIKKENNMNWPLDISTKLAKKKAQRKKLAKNLETLDKEIAELENEELKNE